MVASTQSVPVIAIGWRTLKQPKLSRTDYPRVERMKKFQRQITKGEREGGRKCVNRSLVSAFAKAGDRANR